MELFLLRHGEAGYQEHIDAQRELTERGTLQLQQILRASHRALDTVQKVWVSPYVRTQQTFAVAKGFLPPDVAVSTTELLTPEEDPLFMLGVIERANVQSALLVTHQPLVGTLLNWLCHFAPGEHVMGTSALAALDVDGFYQGGANLRWLRQP